MADQQLKEHLQQGKFAYEDDMKKLRKLVEDEIIKRRKQQVSLEEVKEFATAKYINSILTAFRKINPSKWPNKIQYIDFIKVLYDLQEKVEKLTTYKNQTKYDDHAGCDAACTGLCASCTGNCTGSNSGQCSGGEGGYTGAGYSTWRMVTTNGEVWSGFINDGGIFIVTGYVDANGKTIVAPGQPNAGGKVGNYDYVKGIANSHVGGNPGTTGAGKPGTLVIR